MDTPDAGPPGPNLRMLALTEQWDELEDAWLEAMDETERPEELLETLEVLSKRGEGERVRVLGGMALGPLNRQGHHALTVAAARLMATQRGDVDAEVPDLVIDAFGRVYAERPEAESLLRKALVYRREKLAVLLRNIDAMFLFREGDVVHHRGGWGYGTVKRIRPRREELTVDFPAAGAKDFKILSAGEYLRKIDPEGFEGLRFLDPERLRRMADEDPAAVLRLVLAGRGGTVFVKVLRDDLCPAVLGEDDWHGWWTRARKEIKYNPYFEMGQGANTQIRLLAEPESFGHAALRTFRTLSDFGEKLRRVRAYVTESKSHIEAPVLAAMLDDLLGAVSGGSRTPQDAAGLWFLNEAVRDKGLAALDLPYRLAEEITTPEAFLQALGRLAITGDQGKVLDFAAANQPEAWPDWFGRAYFLPEIYVWDKVTQMLVEAGCAARAAEAFRELALHPKKHPLAFLWMFRSRLAGKHGEVEAPYDPLDFTEKALTLTNKLKMADELTGGVTPQKVYTKAREILTEDHFRGLFAVVNVTEAKRLIDYVSVSGLKHGYAEVIEQIGISKFPEIVQKKDEGPGYDPDIIYATPEGLERKQREYEQLLNVDIEKNRIALGKALALGDLSENAELDAAREMQAQLGRKANEMEAALAKARVIDFDALSYREVEVGVAVEAEESGGQRQRFLILGPWDVERDTEAISYMAPLGQAFLGRRAGDSITVKLPDGDKEFRLTRIFPVAEARSVGRTEE